MSNLRFPSLRPPGVDAVTDRRLRLLTARGGAEVASMGSAIGAVYFAEKLSPERLKDVQDFLAKNLVAPYLSSFDKLADKMPGFEGSEGVELRHKMSDDEKTQYFAEGLVNYSLMAGGGVVGQTAIQWLLDHVLGLHMHGSFGQGAKKMAIATTVDRGIQLGSIALLTTAMPEASEKLQRSVARNVFKRLGVKDDHVAESNARYLVTWQLPNLVGWVGSLGFLDKVYAEDAKLHAAQR